MNIVLSEEVSLISLLYIKRNNLRDITICVLCTSVLIEAIQLLTPANITDIDDVIFNTLGGILGFFFYKLFQYIKVRLGKR
ncbi:MAG: VanZ family protein [Clostridium sp.]